jgi:hypothetical protein
MFQRSLEIAKRRGVWKKGHPPHERQHIKLALDTTHILGRGAIKDTYNLLADGIVQVLRGLAMLLACDLLDVAEEVGCSRYVQGPSLKGQAEVDWSDPKARQRFLAEIVTDAEQLLELVRGTRATLKQNGPEDQKLMAAAELLARILAQDIERDENGPRLIRGVAPDRVISVQDPEMRHGRKSSSQRFNGHKAQIAVDTDSQLITAVDVLPGNAPDAEGAMEVVEASEAATGWQVKEVIGDCAYGAGETRAEFAASGRTIVAKVPEPYNGELFAKTAFHIDVEARTCTCPNGQTTTDLRPAKDGGGTFVFATERCSACPLRPQCTRSKHGRTVQLNPHEALLQKARELQRTPAFAQTHRQRQAVEHRIARLTQLGIRQARYFGRTKTLFQVCLAAAVANLTLLAATSEAVSTTGSAATGPSLALLGAVLIISSLLLGLVSAFWPRATPLYHHQVIIPMIPTFRSQTPGCRPGF